MTAQTLSRFWRKVDKRPESEGGHWLWTGAVVTSNGYPKFWLDGRLVYAHRFSLALATGNDGVGLDAAHDDSKDCPRHCINPDHLAWKSHKENMIDVINKHGRICVNRNVARVPLPLFDEPGTNG